MKAREKKKVFMDVIGTKILRLLLHDVHIHLHHLIFGHPPWFLGLEISTAKAESRWGLGVVLIISLFTLKVALSFFFLHLKVHKIEIFFGFDFEICIVSLLFMSKY